MKKLISVFLLTCLIFSSISVFAHPGKTDGRGGHYDRQNGGYHYHHGYSAHKHEDMNGDGVLDCPYDFIDKTDHSSGNSSSSKYENDSTKTENNKYYNLFSKLQKNKIITFISNNFSIIYMVSWIFIPWIIIYFLFKE